MPVPDDIELRRTERSAIEAALTADPDLAGELELIAGKLSPAAREAFWRAFAAAAGRHARPAAAVLAALERAAGEVQSS